MKANRKKPFWLLIFGLILIAYWFIPITGTVTILSGENQQGSWPRFDVESQEQTPGAIVDVVIKDIEPWSYVELVVNNENAIPKGNPVLSGVIWSWRWSYTVPEVADYQMVFYTNCHLGCEERGTLTVGKSLPEINNTTVPTKLGVVMPNLERNWHGRNGWGVEITYVTLAEEPYWGVDDLAVRIARHENQGLRVLVRVDYDQRQSIPATNDNVALSEYLTYFSRLSRDARLKSVYGYIVGNDFNTTDAITMHPDKPITPEWYARVFNGYGENPYHTDNVIQTIRRENQNVRVIVGPIRPWSSDADGVIRSEKDMPWLNYMKSLTAYLDEASQTKNEIGVPLTAPDGFDIQAPGRPDAVEMAGYGRYEEPEVNILRESWNNSQAGFRVFKDWLEIINAYPSTRGVPVYIISTNTYDRISNIPPAQNYPQGWLTSALRVVNAEPQIHALCWFLDDFPHSDQWNWFSLTQKPGRLVDAAEEFDALLQIP